MELQCVVHAPPAVPVSLALSRKPTHYSSGLRTTERHTSTVRPASLLGSPTVLQNHSPKWPQHCRHVRCFAADKNTSVQQSPHTEGASPSTSSAQPDSSNGSGSNNNSGRPGSDQRGASRPDPRKPHTTGRRAPNATLRRGTAASISRPKTATPPQGLFSAAASVLESVWEQQDGNQDEVPSEPEHPVWLPQQESIDEVTNSMDEGNDEDFRPGSAGAQQRQRFDPYAVGPQPQTGPIKRRFAARLIYWVQRTLLGTLAPKLALVLGIAVPIVLLVGYAYSRAAHAPLMDSFFKIYGLLYRAPGFTVTADTWAWPTIIVNATFLLGVLFFSVVIGVVIEDISVTLKSVKGGNFPVVAKDHTLVCNWNELTVPLLRQIAVAKSRRREAYMGGPVVVLADRAKDMMEKEIAAGMLGYKMEVITRQGSPHFLKDLDRVSAGFAKTVIVLNPDGPKDPTANMVATAMGLQLALGMASRYTPAHILMQSFEPEVRDDARIAFMAELAGSLRVAELNGMRDLAQLIAQSALNPGVISVYCSLFVPSLLQGPAFEIRGCNGKGDLSYQLVRRSLPGTVVVGYLAHRGGRQTLLLNPRDDALVREGDLLVTLAGNAGVARRNASDWVAELVEDPQPYSQAPVVSMDGPAGARLTANAAVSGAAMPIGAAGGATVKASRVVLLSFDEDMLAQMLDGLAEFAQQDTEVVVVSEYLPRAGFPPSRHAHFSCIQANPSSLAALADARVVEADSVIVGHSAGIPDKDADAQVISMLLLLQGLMRQWAAAGHSRGAPLHIVSRIENVETSRVADNLLAAGRALPLPQAKLKDTVARYKYPYHTGPLASTDQQTLPGNGSQHHSAVPRPVADDFDSDFDADSDWGMPDTESDDADEGPSNMWLTAELLRPRELISGVLTQVAAQPPLTAVLSELLDSSNGCEIYLRGPAQYGLAGRGAMSFGELEELCRLRDETAIGFTQEGSHLALAPGPDAIIRFRGYPDAKIIVIALD